MIFFVNSFYQYIRIEPNQFLFSTFVINYNVMITLIEDVFLKLSLTMMRMNVI